MFDALTPPGHSRFIKPIDRKPPTYNGKGNCVVFLYAAYCKGHAKIGLADEPKKRVATMQAGCPFLIELLVAHPLTKEDAIKAERSAHLMLNDAHWIGEWFKCTRNHALYATSEAIKGCASADHLPIKRHGEILGYRYYRRSRGVETPDGRFASSTEAAKHYGVSRQAIHLRIRRGKPGWKFIT